MTRKDPRRLGIDNLWFLDKIVAYLVLRTYELLDEENVTLLLLTILLLSVVSSQYVRSSHNLHIKLTYTVHICVSP